MSVKAKGIDECVTDTFTGRRASSPMGWGRELTLALGYPGRRRIRSLSNKSCSAPPVASGALSFA